MNHKILSGIVLLFLGFVFLAQNFDILHNVINLGHLWPVFMIIGGLYMMFNKPQKDEEGE